MEQNPDASSQSPENSGQKSQSSAQKLAESKKNKPETVGEQIFHGNTLAMLETVFTTFFNKLKDTPINIKASTSGDYIDEAQKAEFAKRSGIIEGYRGTYLNISPETTTNILNAKQGEEAFQNLDQYINRLPGKTVK